MNTEINTWKTKGGQEIPINELETDHLINIIKMIVRNSITPFIENAEYLERMMIDATRPNRDDYDSPLIRVEWVGIYRRYMTEADNLYNYICNRIPIFVLLIAELNNQIVGIRINQAREVVLGYLKSIGYWYIEFYIDNE